MHTDPLGVPKESSVDKLSSLHPYAAGALELGLGQVETQSLFGEVNEQGLTPRRVGEDWSPGRASPRPGWSSEAEAGANQICQLTPEVGLTSRGCLMTNT